MIFLCESLKYDLDESDRCKTLISEGQCFYKLNNHDEACRAWREATTVCNDQTDRGTISKLIEECL